MDISTIAALTLGAYITWSGLMAILHPPVFLLFNEMFITGRQYRLGAVIVTAVQLLLVWLILVK